MIMESMKALKLDSSFRPIGIIDSIEALVLCIIGKARPLEDYTDVINSVSKSFNLPAVIVLNRYVKYRFSHIACNRANILWRDNNRCQYCKKVFPVEKLTLDHVTPKSRGGKNTWKNLVAACKKCNQKKANRTPSESGMRPMKEPRQPRPSILRFLKKEQINPIWRQYLWEF
jgi:5-methylcytosine-specific restriction endonuclease McrA